MWAPDLFYLLHRQRAGSSIIEYALIVALIAVATAGMTHVGHQINSIMMNIGYALDKLPQVEPTPAP